MFPRSHLCRVALGASLLLAGSGCVGCDPCAPPEDTALDYASDQAWLCRPDLADDACRSAIDAVEVLADGSVQEHRHQPGDSPGAECFYVYPTVDMGLTRGVHSNFARVDTQRMTVRTQAARFAEVCAVHAPLYRQVTLGTYAVKPENQQACFDLAYGDVRRAFESFLDRIADDRDIVLIGHSQGAQNVSKLLQAFFDGGQALADRLVTALPLGWPVATAMDQTTGGSFADLPVCEGRDQQGCVVGLRSYLAHLEMPGFQEQLIEGEQIICSNPADLEGNSNSMLSRSYFRPGTPYVDLPQAARDADVEQVLYREAFRSQCRSDGRNQMLAIEFDPADGDQRANPLDLDASLVSGASGSHVLDVALTQGDLIDLVGHKIAVRP